MKTNVLIIDDDEAVCFFHTIRVIENKLCATPLCFKNGKEALDHLDRAANQPAYYLVLLDLNMPVMNGWSFLQAIADRNYYERVKVFILSSSVNFADKEKAKMYDCVIEFIEKPLTDEDCQRIAKVNAEWKKPTPGIEV